MNPAERARAGIVRADPASVPGLATFQTAHFGPGSRQSDAALSAWRFGAPPGRRGDEPLFWACRQGDAVVGQQGGLPAPLVTAEGTIDGCWAIDLMVAPEWRLRGVGPALWGALLDTAPVVCGLNVSHDARRAFLRAGWIDLGRVPRLARLLRPLADGQAPLDSSWKASGWEARLSRLGAPLLAAHDRILLPVARGGTTLERLDAIAPAMETVWREAAPCYDVAVRRDLPLLRWRFDEAPHAGVYERWLLRRRGAPVAYAVTRRRGEAWVVVDFFCRPEEVRALFAHLVEVAKARGALLLTCLALPRLVRAQLRILGFLERPGPSFMVYMRDSSAPPAEVLRRADCWFVTEADSDLDHMRTSGGAGLALGPTAGEGYAGPPQGPSDLREGVAPPAREPWSQRT